MQGPFGAFRGITVVFPQYAFHQQGHYFRQAPASSSIFALPVTFLSLTPLPLSVYNLQSPSAADINIDIETVEKLIGEIIAQPLR